MKTTLPNGWARRHSSFRDTSNIALMENAAMLAARTSLPTEKQQWADL
ncbi:MAG: hypothetical protein ACLUKN_06990 [Bacilli bacterium]